MLAANRDESVQLDDKSGFPVELPGVDPEVGSAERTTERQRLLSNDECAVSTDSVPADPEVHQRRN
jgi:hypothetical protein